MMKSDLGLYQRGCSWDPGGLALRLSMEVAHRVVFSRAVCVIILVVHYLIHASDISLHQLPGFQSTQGTTSFMRSWWCESLKCSTTTLAVRDLVPSTCYNQGHFQEARGTITIAVVFVQGSVNHEYYFLSFDHDCAENDYFLDTFGGAPIGRNYRSYFVEVLSGFDRDDNQVKHHQVQWDPGGSRWCRLGSSRSQEGRDVRSPPLAGTWACPWTGTWVWPIERSSSAADYKYQGEGNALLIQWITDGSAAATFLSSPYLQFFPVLPQFACNLWL